MTASLPLAHALLGLVYFIAGILICTLRKGDGRHKLLGWVYVVLITVSLAAAITSGIVRGWIPFHGYAVAALLFVASAVAVSRLRARLPQWRAWHGALMSLSLLGSLFAVGGVVVGGATGTGSGPAFYRLFNLTIVVMTVVGLWFIGTRRVIWGPSPGPMERRVRGIYTGLAAAASLVLVVAQLGLT